MSSRWLDDHAERALLAAVAQIESTSAVEVAIAVRQSAQSWPHVPMIVGGAAAWATLAFMLFSEPSFALPAFLVDPLIVGGIAGWAATTFSAPVRWLTSDSSRRAAAVRSARATFVERGVQRTRARTGLLVYCALAERVAVVVADSGVEAALPAGALTAWQRRIDESLVHGGAAAAAAVAAMAPTFADAVPRDRDDVNELHDAIEHDIDRRPRA
jgi:putative membrane protein